MTTQATAPAPAGAIDPVKFAEMERKVTALENEKKTERRANQIDRFEANWEIALKEGRVAPATKSAFLRFYEAAIDGTPVKFSADAAEQPLDRAFCQLLRGLPKVVEFGEISADAPAGAMSDRPAANAGENTPKAKAPAGNEHGEETHKAVLKYMQDNKIEDYGAALIAFTRDAAANAK